MVDRNMLLWLSLDVFHLEDLPLLCCESALYIPCELETSLRITRVLVVIVADGELCVGLLGIGLIHDTDVTAPKYWAFIGVTGDCELRQIQIKSLAHIY